MLPADRCKQLGTTNKEKLLKRHFFKSNMCSHSHIAKFTKGDICVSTSLRVNFYLGLSVFYSLPYTDCPGSFVLKGIV